MQQPGEVAEDARKNRFNKKKAGCSRSWCSTRRGRFVYFARLLVHIRGLLSQTV